MVGKKKDPPLTEKNKEVIKFLNANRKLMATGVGVEVLIGKMVCELLGKKEAITKEDVFTELHRRLALRPVTETSFLDMEKESLEGAITFLRKDWGLDQA